jgi:two-component system, NarL family, response regulator DesR
MQPQSATRILIDIDNPLLRAGIEAILRGQAQLETSGPGDADVILRHQVRGRAAPARTVLLAPPAPSDELLSAAAAAGVGAIVAADEPIAGLVKAIRSVHAGHGWTSSDIGGRLLGLCGRQPVPPPRCDDLTPREQQVLDHIADGESNQEIATRLTVTIRTVKHHVSNLLIKLGARDRAHAVALAYHRRRLTVADRS